MPPRDLRQHALRALIGAAVLCAAAAPAIRAAESQTELEALLRDATAPRLAESSRDAAGLRLDTGRLHVYLSEGILVPVLDGGGTVGFFFLGEGEASWDTGAAIAPAAFERNLDDLASATARARRKETSRPSPNLAEVPARFPITQALLLSSLDWTGPAGPVASAKPVTEATTYAFTHLIREISTTGGWDHPVRRLASRLEPGPAVTRVDLIGRSRLVARLDGVSGLATLSEIHAKLPDPP